MANIGEKRIGTVRNYYGGLFVMEKDGKYYWIIESHNTKFSILEDWYEIDKELFDSLIAYEGRRDKTKIR